MAEPELEELELDNLELGSAKPDATSPAEVGVSLQAKSGPIPAATTPPLRIRRNSRRSASA